MPPLAPVMTTTRESTLVEFNVKPAPCAAVMTFSPRLTGDACLQRQALPV